MFRILFATLSLTLLAGCLPNAVIDRRLDSAIQKRQMEAIADLSHARVPLETDRAGTTPESYLYAPSPRPEVLPPGYEPGDAEQQTPEVDILKQATAAASQPTTRPAQRFQDEPFTLTRAVRYALRNRRAYQTAKEDLYLVTLAVLLERHLWTPQFAAELRSVYGNFGEITDFDQATRFVADLSVAQRLPYGGSFTARAVSTLIRDVKKSITAREDSSIELGLDIPFLRGAGRVAREALIQVERDLTYAVRAFERFRREQLTLVAADYFDLLRSKQAVLDAETSVQRAISDYAQAEALEQAGEGTPLDTRRAEQRLLQEINRLAQLRESFRFATDRFKLLIGMPVNEQIGLDDFQTIEELEAEILAGKYPLLLRAAAADDERASLEVAERYRLDVLTALDRIGDARRGVANSRNALLPDLDWTSTVLFGTDAESFNAGDFEIARTEWRTEIVLAMNDRFRERTQFRSSLVDLKRVRRQHVDVLERVRVDVRQAINQIRLQENLVAIQEKNLAVAEKRAEFARLQSEEGDISNRDLIEAENDLIAAQNSLNSAKTERWSRLLDYRLATGTLFIDDEGQQE